MTASEVVDAILACGCKPEVSANWVKFVPPPPIDLLVALTNFRGDEIAKLCVDREAARSRSNTLRNG